MCSFFAQSVEYLYVGRFAAGISGGACYMVIPIFISEISDAKWVKLSVTLIIDYISLT